MNRREFITAILSLFLYRSKSPEVSPGTFSFETREELAEIEIKPGVVLNLPASYTIMRWGEV